MSGLFVYKHAEAVRAQGCDVRVLFSQGWFDTWRQWRALQRSGWMPDVVQLNVIQKQGLLALWLKRHYAIPYIIIEHWSGYLPENGMFRRFPRFKQRILRRICHEAEAVLPVSLPLQRAMQACGMEARRWDTIDNVVDGFFFEDRYQVRPRTKTAARSDQEQRPKILLHVSCFDERAKNVEGLLRAAKMLSEKRQDWRLVLVGTGINYKDVRAYAQTLGIPEGMLEWTGELTPQQVAHAMQQADALVLSSRYETYGVVLAEAAAAQLPVVSTPVGIAEETGALIVSQEIAQHKPGKFAEFMEAALWSKDRYQVRPRTKTAARCDQDRFTKEAIGKKLKTVYDSCLHRDI